MKKTLTTLILTLTLTGTLWAQTDSYRGRIPIIPSGTGGGEPNYLAAATYLKQDRVVDVRWYGAAGDAVSAADGVTVAGDATFTSATAAWTAADIGKTINIAAATTSGGASDGVAVAGNATFTSEAANWVGADKGKTIVITGAGAAGAAHVTTIAAVGAENSITLTDAPVTSVNPATFTYVVPFATTVASVNTANSIELTAAPTYANGAAKYTYGTDDTAAIAAALAALPSGGTLFFPSGTYLTDSIDASAVDDLIVQGVGGTSILKRRTSVGSMILGGLRLTVRDLVIDGDKDVVPSASGSDHGIYLGGDNSTVERVTVRDCYKRGVWINADRCFVVDSNSLDNGLAPGDYGTGDGFYIGTGTSYNTLLRCLARNNSRTGIVVTCNVAETPTVGNRVIACLADGTNDYTEIDTELSTDTWIQDCTVNGMLTVKDSIRNHVINNELSGATAQIYANGGTELEVIGNTVHATNNNQRIYIVGSSPVVKDNCVYHSAAPASGYSIYVTNNDADGDTGIFTGNYVYQGARGMVVANAREYWGNRCDSCTDGSSRFLLANDTTGRSVSAPQQIAAFEIHGGRATIWNTAAPAAGTYTAGDICWNSALSAGESVGWQCVVAGTPGTWVDLVNVANGGLSVKNGSTSAGYVDLYEDSDDGAHYLRQQSQAMAGNVTLTWPSSAGEPNEVLKSNGSGTMDWLPLTSEDVNNVGADITNFDTHGLHIISSNTAEISGALADGTFLGQRVKFVCKVAGNNITISVAHHVTSDPEVILLDTAKEWVELVWDGADWVEVSGNGQTYP